MRRSYFPIAYALLLVVCAATSPPRRVGDGGEYVAMALNLARTGSPSFTRDDIDRVEAELRSIGSGFEIVRLTMPGLEGRDGRQEMPHFWLYSATAAPFVVLAETAGIHVNHAFTLVNAALLLVAAVVIARHAGAPLAALILVSPIVWWVDKAHGDSATYALLAIGLTLIRGPLWIAAPILGIAAAQNPAIALTWPALVLAGLPANRARWRDRRLWMGIGTGLLLLLLHPLYYGWRLGVPTPLLAWTARHVPGPWEMSRFLIDPNIGLFFGFPGFLLALAGATAAVAVRAPGRLVAPPLLLTAACAVVLLGSFAQTVNANHGGTPAMNRWTLWLVPLGIPLLREFTGRSGRAFVIALAVVSAGWSLALFHPRWPEMYTRPSRAAAFLWERYPAVDHPTPEVFGERLTRREPPVFPVATASCSKVLLLEGRWPAHCAPDARMPPRCRRPGRVCYANRGDDGYGFVESAIAPGLHFRVETPP